MKKPLIGILPLVDMQRDSYWMLPGYMNGIVQAGGIPLMLPLTSDEQILQQLVSQLDGFLFTGGQDVSPARYAETASSLCGECCVQRDAMETLIFHMAYACGKPMLGICRGIQFFNVVFGGTLYQDLPTEHPSNTEHHQQPPYDLPIHAVSLVNDSPLHALLGQDTLMVNSYHHQAIKQLAPNLQPMAISEDGLIEAVCVPDKKFIWAVQWHPEFSYHCDENSRKILQHFVNAAG